MSSLVVPALLGAVAVRNPRNRQDISYAAHGYTPRCRPPMRMCSFLTPPCVQGLFWHCALAPPMALALLAPRLLAMPSVEAQMNAETGSDMKAQERLAASGRPLSHYMPVGLLQEVEPGKMSMPAGVRIEPMPNSGSESVLMPAGAEHEDVHPPHMDAASALEEREEIRAARATSRHATMLFSPESASPSERSGDPSWMAVERARSQ